MRIFVDAWEPGYGTAMDLAEDGPAQRSAVALDTDLELPADEWRPLLPRPGTNAPSVVHVVDGVRRIDARVWLESGDQTYAGIAASYAAGMVRCDLRAGVAELVRAKIERGLFSDSPDVEPIGAPPARYEAFPLGDRGPNVLVNAVQARMTGIENEICTPAFATGAFATAVEEESLVVRDGPLRTRASGANMIGYVKTHSRQYLDDRLTAVVTGLHPGQRSPIFTIESQRPVHSWYLRLPGPLGSAWAGIVRIECGSELSTDAAVALADMSAATLPRFASTSYKDARAPQNLVPIAGLERRLRALLGDSRLLHRTLVRNASLASRESAAVSASVSAGMPPGAPA
jgi:uncharacterized protein